MKDGTMIREAAIRRAAALRADRVIARVDYLLARLRGVQEGAGDDFDLRAEHIETELRLLASGVRGPRRKAVA